MSSHSHSPLLSNLLLLLVVAVATAAARMQSNVAAASPVINVTGGQIQGEIEPFFGTFTFKGVPFAAPPVGTLRFQPTAPVQAWSGVKQTTAYSAGCMQHCVLPQPSITCPPVISEDCLYLNIWTPELNPDEPMPVMVFIHGGAFVQGAAGVPLYDAAGLVANQRVVFVSGNYRLGLMGALYTSASSGNFMLHDQRMLLRWVRDNVAAFGGDPNRVTVSGQSAGAISIGTHLVAPGSQGLFRGAIMDSNPYGLLLADTKLALALGDAALKKLGCDGASTATQQMLCLQSVPAAAVQNVSDDTRNFPWPNSVFATMVPWTPVVDGVVVPSQPIFAKTTPVPVMMGTMLQDATPFINDLSSKPITNFELDVLLGYVFGVENALKIKEAYGAPPNKDDTRLYFSQIATAYMFYCPNRFVARNFAAGSPDVPVYKYLFSHLPSMSTWIWNEVDPLCDDQVCHSDDLFFMFANSYAVPSAPKPTTEEQALMKYVQKIWTNFVKYANPNGAPGNATLYPAFPKYNAANDTTLSERASLSVPLQNYDDVHCDMFDKMGYNRW